MKKRILSVFLALSMTVCAFSGCSDSDNDGNLKETVSYETVEIYNIRYKIRSDFKDISDYDGGSEGMYSYENETVFFIDAPKFYDTEKSSPETYIEYLNLVHYNAEDVTSDIIYGDEYDIVEYSTGTEEGGRFTTYTINRQGHDLNGTEIMVTYIDLKDEELIRQLSLELIENMEYIGEPREIVTSFDCDCFSMELSGDMFDFTLNSDPEKNKAVAKYQYYDNFCKRLSKIEVTALADSEYSSTEEYLQSQLDKAVGEDSSKEERIIEDITEAEILGYDGYSIVYRTNSLGGFPTNTFTEYAFDKDGIIYSVELKVADTDGNEQIKADFEKLIDCIKIK